MAFVLSGFADEISPDLDVQLQTMTRLGVKGLDLRSVDGINVLALDEARLEQIKNRCQEAGIHIQCIGSPVNKVPLAGTNQAAETAKLERAIHVAQIMETQFIRIFSPEVPESDLDIAWTAVEAWMAEQVFLAEKAGITLLHENDARFYGAYPEGAKRLFDRFGGPNFRAAFDFANTVLIGFRPTPDWFPWLLPHLHTLHIKDAIEATREIVPAGKGDGQMLDTLDWLLGQNWSGPLTIEPHLSAAGPFGGFSGEELFEEAVTALRTVAGSAGISAL